MRIIVRVISLLGSAACIAWFVFLSQFSWGDGSGGASNLEYTWGVCPLIYFAIVFCTTFTKRRGFGVLVAGIVSHSILAGLYFSIYNAGFTGVIILVPVIFCAVMWGLMYLSLSDEPAA
jgi:hypothetical protein